MCESSAVGGRVWSGSHCAGRGFQLTACRAKWLHLAFRSVSRNGKYLTTAGHFWPFFLIFFSCGFDKVLIRSNKRERKIVFFFKMLKFYFSVWLDSILPVSISSHGASHSSPCSSSLTREVCKMWVKTGNISFNIVEVNATENGGNTSNRFKQ